MAFAKDQWTKAVKQPDGSVKRERDEKRWGRGKRWLGVWIDPHGKERSKAFQTKVRALQYAKGMETDRDRGAYLDPNAGKVRLEEIWIGSRTVDPASEIQYQSKWRLHVQPMFGRRTVKSILPSEIAVWLTDLISAYGASTARSAFPVPNGWLATAGVIPPPGFTLQMYTHMLPSSYDRARQAVDRRLERLSLRLTEQSESRDDPAAAYEQLDKGPGLL